MESVKQVQAALKQLNTATSTLHTSLSTLQEGESSGATNRDAVGGDYLSGGATEMGSSGELRSNFLHLTLTLIPFCAQGATGHFILRISNKPTPSQPP